MNDGSLNHSEPRKQPRTQVMAEAREDRPLARLQRLPKICPGLWRSICDRAGRRANHDAAQAHVGGT